SVRAAASERAHRAEPNWTSLAAACKGRPGERGCEAAGMAVVTLDGIGRNYGAGVAVLSEISLTLEAGEFCFLTGAAGAGKTTLLNIIALAEEPSAGRLTLFETDVAAADRMARAALRRRIGIVFQDLRLLDHLSASDNIALPLHVAGMADAEIREHVGEVASWLGIDRLIELRPAALSLAERQCVAIARAIVSRPDLVLADEPTSHMDDEGALTLIRALEQLSRLDQAETARLLEPWLGPAAAPDTLPIPRLLDIRTEPGAAIDITDLRQKLAAITPGSQLEDHRPALAMYRRAATRAAILIAL